MLLYITHTDKCLLSIAGQHIQRPKPRQLNRQHEFPTVSPASPDWWPKSSPLPSTSQVSERLISEGGHKSTL